MEPGATRRGGPFPETGWTVIERCQGAGGDERRGLLEHLVGLYWPPVHAYVRRHSNVDDEEAKDLTQSFFVRFIDEGFLRTVDADRGRFRGFLCASVRRFLIDQYRERNARKRRPEGAVVPLQDAPDLEARSAEATQAFDLEWKRSLIEMSVRRLQVRTDGKSTKSIFVDLFVERDLMTQEGAAPSYQDLAARHGLPVSQVANGLRWARQEFASILKTELVRRSASEEDSRREATEMFGIDLS